MPKIFLGIKGKGLAQKGSSQICGQLFFITDRKMNSALNLACFFAIFQIVYAVPECYHAWSELIPGKACKVAGDCGEATADCIFSVATNSRVCCKPKSGATLPSCPSGMQILSVGKNGGIVCESKDQCPDGFNCVESTTNFDKLSGQGNKVCCK